MKRSAVNVVIAKDGSQYELVPNAMTIYNWQAWFDSKGTLPPSIVVRTIPPKGQKQGEKIARSGS